MQLRELFGFNYSFALREYSRDITQRQFGSRIVPRFKHLYSGFISSADSDQEIATKAIKFIESHDPTLQKLYVPWLAKEFASMPIDSIETSAFLAENPSLSDALLLYNEVKLSSLFKNEFKKYIDIMKVSVDDLLAIHLQLERIKERIEASKFSKIKPAYSDAVCRIFVPTTEEQSCKYGANTKWCTAGKKDNRFHSYTSNGALYILIPTRESYAGEKYQFQFADSEFTDEKNNSIPNIRKFLTTRFSGAFEYLKSVDTAKSIVFWSDATILKINRTVADAVSSVDTSFLTPSQASVLELMTSINDPNVVVQVVTDFNNDVDRISPLTMKSATSIFWAATANKLYAHGSNADQLADLEDDVADYLNTHSS